MAVIGLRFPKATGFNPWIGAVESRSGVLTPSEISSLSSHKCTDECRVLPYSPPIH